MIFHLLKDESLPPGAKLLQSHVHVFARMVILLTNLFRSFIFSAFIIFLFNDYKSHSYMTGVAAA